MGEMPAQTRLIRNLKDAGCDDKIIQRFLQLQKEGRTKEQLRLLAMHRAELLDRVHISQSMIDCLDYLVYSIKNEEK